MNLIAINLPLIALLPFIGAALVAWASKFNRVASAWTAALITLINLALITPSAIEVFAGNTLYQSWSWIPALGLDFAFRLDGLSVFFALLILLIGLLIIVYARYYLSERDHMGRFFSYMMMFMGSMLGIVLSENLIQMVVFWELTSLTSFLLISYWQGQPEARKGARMSLIITGFGGLALLGGVLLIGKVVGSYNLTVVLASGDLLRSHELYLPILLLVLLGVFTKSAQFPFHFWLPHAMAAPTPVSAYLHSATMVKAGIFLLARLFPVMSGTTEWTLLVGGAGLITFMLGAFTALFKDDLKGLLAYSTISHLGLITLLFGFGTQVAAVAAIFHIINHATFKASLFMVAGIIDHETGTRDMRRLSGLLKFMPQTALLAMIAASSMAGIPLLNGFLSKEMFFEQAVNASQASMFAWLLPVAVTIAAMFSVAYSLRFIHDVFFGPAPQKLPKEPKEPSLLMKIPVGILVVLCIAVGIFPMYTVAPILSIAVAGSLQTAAPEFSLAIWHGFNMPVAMSFIAFALGILIYFKRDQICALRLKLIEPIDARNPYNLVTKFFKKFAASITSTFDKGSMQHAIAWLLAAGVFAGFYGFWQFGGNLFGERQLLPVDPVSLIIAGIVMIAAVLSAALHHNRFLILFFIGAIGLIVAMIFVKFSAPDLALTQISVETVSIVLLLLALYFLPDATPKELTLPRAIRDLIIAIAAGVGVTLLTLAVLTREFDPISSFFIENSVVGGGGTNVVNVILVDFRGFDTLGEAVFFALAGLGIYAMLRDFQIIAPEQDKQGRNWTDDVHPMIMRTFTRLSLPLMLLVAAFIFIRGHDLPGGGFIAGLIAATALVVQYLANGIEWSSERLKIDMHWSIALGLFFAAGTGVAAFLVGYPFLTSHVFTLTLPLLGELHFASAIAFDLGVFLIVVGSSVLILLQIGNLSYHTPEVEPAKTDAKASVVTDEKN